MKLRPTLYRAGWVLPVASPPFRDGALLVDEDGRIAAVGAEPPEKHDTVIDAGGAYLLPGFIQTHIHLCQTLFRGYADDLRLLETLEQRARARGFRIIGTMSRATSTKYFERSGFRVAGIPTLHLGTTHLIWMEKVLS